MSSRIEKIVDALKFIFDVIRLPFYFTILACRLLIIGSGVAGVCFTIYQIYQGFIHFRIYEDFGIIGTIIAIFIVLIPLSGIGYIWYNIIYILHGILQVFISYPFEWNNDVLVNIQCFFEDLPYYLIPGKKDEVVQMIGFKSTEDLEKFDETHPDLYKQYTKDDIDNFYKSN